MKKGIILKRDNLGLLIESEKQKYRAEMSKAEAAAYKEGMSVTFDLATNEKGKEVAVNVQAIMKPEPPQKTAPAVSNLDVHKHPAKEDVIRPPYRFVPIPTKGGQVVGVTDAPVFHDGAQAGKGNLWSGELRCTMAALTPLLAANDEYDARYVKGAVQKEKSDKIHLPGSWGIPTPVDPDKKVLEPLRLPDGRVLISGRSLKGMLRHSLGALLAAPMERVREHTFSYRPNLAFASQKVKYEYRPAVVINGNEKSIEVKVLKESQKIQFLKSFEYDKLGKPKPGVFLPNVNKYYFPYLGGIDGTGTLHRAFRNGKGDIYRHVLIDKSDFDDGKPLIIDEPIIRQYALTQEHLADMETGHLRADHPLGAKINRVQVHKEINDNQDLLYRPNQMIYVEVELDHKKNPLRIVSMGRHFRYRWRHAGSVRKVNADDSRPVVTPLPQETTPDAAGRPSSLSAARLLFGYVSDDKNSGTKNIGQGDFQKLSGRLAFNMAVEQIQNPEPGKRFVNHASECVVPLKILGQPRPSAAEFYLRQDEKEIKKRPDGGVMVTYGDLAGDDPVGELNGRKFYLHQPKAAEDSSCYLDTSEETVTGNQAALGRFVSRPGSTFRFTLRFRYLRPWELGAVLFALEPERWIDRLLARLPETWKTIPSYVESIRAADSQQPLFALKLGHGRPLGLGSIQIQADRALFLGTDQALFEDDARLEQAIQDFAEKLGGAPEREEGKAPEREEVLLHWLKIHRYAGRARADYPRVFTNKKGEILKPGEQIFTYHQVLRQRHARGRRCQGPGNPYPDLLQPLDKRRMTE